MPQQSLRNYFNQIDTDNSGYLSESEIMAAIPGGDRKKAAEILVDMDKDQDGQVSYEEFIEAFYPDSDDESA